MPVRALRQYQSILDATRSRNGQNPINARKGITTQSSSCTRISEQKVRILLMPVRALRRTAWHYIGCIAGCGQNPINARKGITTRAASHNPLDPYHVRILLMPVRALRHFHHFAQAESGDP